MLDLFAGRCGWSKAFAERGWECVAIDLTMPTTPIPEGVEYIVADVLKLEAVRSNGETCIEMFMPDKCLGKFDFICASSPCEQFSVHGMKHFHPNPKYPEMGIKLFNHTRMLCESSGVPYVMENVRPAQSFVGNATQKCGPFYLWGSGVPPLMPKGITKGIDVGSSKAIRGMSIEQKREYRAQFVWNQAWSKSASRMRDTAKAATIPPELSSCVCDYAEALMRQRVS